MIRVRQSSQFPVVQFFQRMTAAGAGLAIALVAVTGCGKSVRKGGGLFGQQAQTEPAPTGSPTPSPTVSPTPSPTVSPTPVTCVDKQFSVFDDFSVYSCGAITYKKSDADGRLAGGSTVKLATAQIGHDLKPDALRADVVSGSSMDYNTGEVASGSIAFGTTGKIVNVTALGGWGKGAPVDFGARTSELHRLSTGLGAVAGNGKVTLDCKEPKPPRVGAGGGGFGCVLYLDGALADLNVFTVKGLDLGKVFAVYTSIPPGATALVNVQGSGNTLDSVDFFIKPGMIDSKIVWNWAAATKLAIKKTKFYGSIVAPKADVDTTLLESTGGVFAKTLDALNSTFEGTRIDACLPVVP